MRWLENAPPVAECRARSCAELGLPPDALLGVGVDRLDYTKGIEERLLGGRARCSSAFPELRGRFTFVQLAAPEPDRDRAVPRAQRARRATARRRINERFGTGGYQPIMLLARHHEPPSVFRYYRAADSATSAACTTA